MAGAKSRKRNLSTAQIKLRMLAFGFDGTALGPALVATGFDQFNISSITKLAPGQYTVIFKKPFERACELLSWVSKTAGIQECEVVATAYDRVTFTTKNSAGVDTDALLFLSVLGSDARYDVE